MKRTVAAGAAFALVLLGAPSPANAAPAECDTLAPLGFVCVTINGDQILDAAGQTIGTLGSIPAPVTITVPSPTTVTAPAPAPVTRTATRTATETATVTPAPVTQTTTATRTVIPSRQSANPSATLGAPPNVPVPGPVEAGVDLIPDDPDVAAATGSLVGLFVGILLGLVGLFVAYRRGQIDGEKATLKEFLGVIRGEPQPGRHRA